MLSPHAGRILGSTGDGLLVKALFLTNHYAYQKFPRRLSLGRRLGWRLLNFIIKARAYDGVDPREERSYPALS